MDDKEIAEVSVCILQKMHFSDASKM